MTAPPTDLVAHAKSIVDTFGPGATFDVDEDKPIWGQPWKITWWGGPNERCGVLCTLLDGDAAHRAVAVLRAAGFTIGRPATPTLPRRASGPATEPTARRPGMAR